ncbi:MAG: amidohydrolase family protein [Pseudomonadota bacterium]
MKKISAIAFVLGAAGCAGEPPSPVPSMQFINGQWFDGAAFEERNASIIDGRLVFDAPVTADAIDLNGQYVVPPYCEGHNHHFGGDADTAEATAQHYLEDGVFYAMMPGSFKLYRDLIASDINHPKSVDVVFANNGLTGSGGHPRGLRESLMERFGNYPEFTKETLPDKGYFEAETLEEVREKMALILAERPDLVKVMLFFSEEYESRKDDPKYYGRRGLNPDLLPEAIRIAHAAGLRVAVHVESEADMTTALLAGADIIAHLPSYDSSVLLSDETIALATETNAALVTTFSLASRFQTRAPDCYAAAIEAQRENLVRLHEAGALLVIGSDGHRDTSRGEADHIASLGVLDNATILKMWTKNCARMVFPDRKIGRLHEGYEASFLVLENNPLEDFAATGDIIMRIKDGELLSETME